MSRMSITSFESIIKELISNYDPDGVYRIDIEPSTATNTANWHNSLSLNIASSFKPGVTTKIISGISFRISNSPTGCGLMLFHGFSGSHDANLEITKLIFNEAVKYVRNGGSDGSCLLATLGSTFYNTAPHKLLLELGFKEVDEFRNLRHGGSGQKIFTLEIVDYGKRNTES